MKIAYVDCFSGISGDMVLGALVDLGVDIVYLRKELDKLGISGYTISAKKVEKNHICGTKVDIDAKEGHKHRGLRDINGIIDKSALDKDVKDLSKKIFLRLGEAESRVHNTDIEKIHFHEVGALDAIIDIVGIAIGLKKINVDKIYCSKLHVGSGFVRCAHGIMPVPAPATIELLKGFPAYSTDVKGELVTPTGAAVITSIARDFGGMPQMRVDKIGYGAGKSDFEHPNLLRIVIGERADDCDNDVTDVIEANIDDMNPEYYGHVIEKLLESGALDAYLTNIMMKKGRPAVKLSVICAQENTDRLAEIIFRETTTLGVRIYETRRKKLFVEKKEVVTKYGTIGIKIGKLKSGIVTVSPEYRDCKKIADEKDVALRDVYDLAKKRYHEMNDD